MQALHSSSARLASLAKSSALFAKEDCKSSPLLPPRRKLFRISAALAKENSPNSDVPQPNGLTRAVQNARSAIQEKPVETIGTAAVYSGVGAASVIMSAAVLNSVDQLPLFPQVLQVLGVSSAIWFTALYLTRKAGAKVPSSPIRALSQLLDKRPVPVELDLSEVPGLDDDSRLYLKGLAEARDAALAELEGTKGAVEKMARVSAEKEALEAVAMQLAEERDEALGEVHALKSAVDSMTERMRAIEAMLAQEVEELRQQNQALETVALQLASERDSALSKVADLKKAIEEKAKALAERDAIKLVAAQLAEERDGARKEVEELHKVVASLRHDSGSGLTPEAEVFLKSRLRDLRSDFISVDKSYDEQQEAAEKLVCHLVDEFGAPDHWTRDYLKQFLGSSAKSSKSLGGKGVSARSQNKKATKAS